MKNIRSLLIMLFLIHCAVVSASALPYSATGNKPNYLQQEYKGNDSAVILIPFEYKQSALYHGFTYEVIDSVVNLLLKDSSITLSINGYAHPDEGSDTICKYLSLNRALFVRDYILGRGVAPFRIIYVRGMGKKYSDKKNTNKDGHILNCRAELVLNYPAPPPPVVIADRDEDGIADADDGCPDAYGYKENKGCPDSNAVIIPFENEQSFLSAGSYKVLDSVIGALKENKLYKIKIQGYAYQLEGINAVCERLATERADIVKNYFLSRNISAARILSVQSFGTRRPLNAGKNPQQILLNSRAEVLLQQ